MVKPFKLSWPVGHSDSMNEEDVENTKKAIDALGLYEPPKLFVERFSNEPMIQGLKKFQRRKGLEPDGVMNPDGPTHNALNQALDQRRQSISELNMYASHTTPMVARSHGITKGPRFGEALSQLDQTTLPDVSSVIQSQQNDNPGASSKQIAAAPVAVPFAMWLMEFVGASTIVAAMAIYNSWSKSKQKSVRKIYEAHKKDEDSFCQQWLDDEFDRCLTLDQKWWHDCIERAQHRFRLCIRNGGEPHPDEPGEWDEGDMEISPRR